MYEDDNFMLKAMIRPGTFCTYISKVKGCIPVVRTQISFAITTQKVKVDCPIINSPEPSTL